MRKTYRPASPAEESLVAKHLVKGETLFGVNDSQNLYAVRSPDGALRYIDGKTLKPSLLRRLLGA